ncbi:MAG: hypothetical protein AAF363_07425 [Bacteroidota bacterium]
MTEVEFITELQRKIVEVEGKSTDELLMSIAVNNNNLWYKNKPDEKEQIRVGKSIFVNIRSRIAILLCENRSKKGSNFDILLTAGLVSFVQEIGKLVYGTEMGETVGLSIVAAAMALVYNEVKKHGIDIFCMLYYDNID